MRTVQNKKLYPNAIYCWEFELMLPYAKKAVQISYGKQAALVWKRSLEIKFGMKA
jgi:hypothetical protein